MLASADLGRDDFVGATFWGLNDAAIIEPIEVDPIPNVLGDDSSSSEGGATVGQEDAATKGSRPMKATLIEESEDASGDRPL